MHEWLQQYDNQHQYESLIILGTNNLRLLISRIGYHPKDDRILSWYDKLPAWLNHNAAVTRSLHRRSTTKKAAADEARRVLEIVGTSAAATIPQLTQLARRKPFEVGERVVFALDYMGDPGLRALLSLTDHTNEQLVLEMRRRLNGHTSSPLFQTISNVNTRAGVPPLDYESIRRRFKSN